MSQLEWWLDREWSIKVQDKLLSLLELSEVGMLELMPAAVMSRHSDGNGGGGSETWTSLIAVVLEGGNLESRLSSIDLRMAWHCVLLLM